MTQIVWTPDFQGIDTSERQTLTQYDGAAYEIKSYVGSRIAALGAAMPAPTVNFGTGAAHFDSFTWTFGETTYTVPELSIPVGAVVMVAQADNDTGFTLFLTTVEWLRANGTVKAIYV